MPTKLDQKKHDLVTKLGKTVGKRDDAIKALIKQTAQITFLQRAISRTEKRVIEERAVARKATKQAKAGPPPSDAPAPLTI